LLFISNNCGLSNLAYLLAWEPYKTEDFSNQIFPGGIKQRKEQQDALNGAIKTTRDQQQALTKTYKEQVIELRKTIDLVTTEKTVKIVCDDEFVKKNS
jgi:hypothetical protein